MGPEVLRRIKFGERHAHQIVEKILLKKKKIVEKIVFYFIFL